MATHSFENGNTAANPSVKRSPKTTKLATAIRSRLLIMSKTLAGVLAAGSREAIAVVVGMLAPPGKRGTITIAARRDRQNCQDHLLASTAASLRLAVMSHAARSLEVTGSRRARLWRAQSAMIALAETTGRRPATAMRPTTVGVSR